MKKTKLLKNIVLLSAAAALTACAQSGRQMDSIPNVGSKAAYQTKHPIIVSKSQQELDIEVAMGAKGLTSQQQAQLKAFIIDYADKGDGALEVWIPKASDNSASLKIAHGVVRNMLSRHGIKSGNLAYHRYDANGNKNAPLGLKFDRYFASSKKCGNLNKNLATNPNNENYSTFGCAYQNNLAAMVANPRDLIGPGEVTAGSAKRRQIVWNKYVQGQPTATTRSADEKASVEK